MGEYVTYRECGVEFYAPDLSKYIAGGRVEPAWAPVFYNPAMVNNRTISVMVVRGYLRENEDATLCEPFTGTGIRSLRYAVEAGVKKIIAGDIDDRAVELAKMNVDRLGLRGVVEVVRDDANALIPRVRCDIIDIDPYGTPAPYLQAALRYIKPNGLICATATDLAVLQGSYPDKAVRRYGFKPMRGPISREVGLRGLLGFIAREALKNDRAIRPILAYWEGHYFRVCAVVDRGRGEARGNVRELGYAYLNPGSLERGFKRGYPYVRGVGNVELAGPIWIGPLGDLDFILNLNPLNDCERRAFEIIDALINDLSPIPLYYLTSEVGRVIKHTPGLGRLISLLRGMGYEAYRTHFSEVGFKTDAEPGVIIRLAKEA